MITTLRTRFITHVTGRTIARASAFRFHGSRVLSIRLAATANACRAAHAITMFTRGRLGSDAGDRPTVTASPLSQPAAVVPVNPPHSGTPAHNWYLIQVSIEH